jgi:hypothetical protein
MIWGKTGGEHEGGPGSGTWRRPFSKRQVEAYRRLDVRQWHRHRMLQPGRLFSWAWSTPEGTVVASILAHVTPSHVRLTYRYRGREDAWQDSEEVIEVTYTPCHYGGERPWFRCPGQTSTGRCSRRVAMLYSAGPYFLCRHCYDLRYESERESPPLRLISKAQKIRERLGGSASLMQRFPPKPPKMRWSTYRQLEHEAQDAAISSLGLALAHDDRRRQRRRTAD